MHHRGHNIVFVERWGLNEQAYVEGLAHILAHGRYLTSIDSFPLPFNTVLQVNQGFLGQVQGRLLAYSYHCSVLRKLRKRPVPGEEMCHPSALSSSISPIWEENASRWWAVSWVPALKSMPGLSRGETKFPEESVTASSGNHPIDSWLCYLCLYCTRNGNKARMSSGQWWYGPSEPRQSVIPQAPARGQPGAKLQGKPAGLLRIIPLGNYYSSRKNKTENFLNKMFSHIPTIFLNLHWKLVPIWRQMKDLK